MQFQANLSRFRVVSPFEANFHLSGGFPLCEALGDSVANDGALQLAFFLLSDTLNTIGKSDVRLLSTFS